jgi:hypothetical protein
VEDGEVLKVQAVDLKPNNLDRRESIIRANQVFKKAK